VIAPRDPPEARPGPPTLEPFGLVLHRDGSWTHEGFPITHPRLRAAFDRSVRFLPREGVYVVQLGRFRGQIEVEEAGFFVREVDLARGTLRLSDGSVEALDVASLRASRFDGAWLCTVKRELRPEGLPARFTHASQAEVLAGVEEGEAGPRLRVAGEPHRLPDDLGAEC
jgi:hypothetical protein